MRPDAGAEGQRWLAQAAHDLDDARFLSTNGRHHLACYLAQQTAEKALKAVLYAAGEATVLGHSVADLAKRAAVTDAALAALVPRASTLDKFYVPTRYPNGLPGGIPAEAFDADDAARAIADADDILSASREAIGRSGA